MEFETVRDQLEELRYQLGALLEQGLAQGHSRTEALRELSETMARSGMEEGAALLTRLCGRLTRGAGEVRWSGEQEAALDFALLWRYTELCLRRLEYLEAKASLSANR